ncbi:CotH kinase family protein [Arcticibacterium luteifluviistationis]|uniref:LTD domain-containing protein n=1 Tax=Arcticibacterium luteifluviistationis TaxID=1784714 RepID=A0A2Z4G7E1_9BACT|nr:hypothetical protein DJ013_02300 [Arcticibacterium luteifluviistationis]
MASNSSSAQDQLGESSDWLEIYNASNSAIDLNGYFISDDDGDFQKHEFEETLIIPSQGYVILWASGDVERGGNHLDFKLSSDGEKLILTAPNGLTVVDSLSFGIQNTDISYGRKYDGSDTLVYFIPSSFNFNNVPSFSYEDYLAPPIFSQPSGTYANQFTLNLNTLEAGAAIYYTLDGSDPDTNNVNGKTFFYKNDYPSSLIEDSVNTYAYNTPILIKDNTGQRNRVSGKLSSYPYSPSYLPSYQVQKGSVVKAMVVKRNALSSPIITQTYFVGSSFDHEFPIVSVTVDEDRLFDHNNGIYPAGSFFEYAYPNGIDDYSPGAKFCTVGNYSFKGDEYKLPGSIEYFDNGLSLFNKRIELSNHGGCSRSAPRKTMRLYFEDDEELSVFDEAPNRLHKRILLRNSGNDWDGLLYRDAYYQDLVRAMSFGKQETKPTVVYLNSEYWGVMNFRDRMDKHYLKNVYEVDEDVVDIISYSNGLELEEGDLDTYNALLSFLNNNDFLIEANYDSLKNLIDEDSFIDYQIAEVFSGNGDWLINNTKIWRSKAHDSGNGYSDGRWRWLMYDMDYTMDRADYDHLQHYALRPDAVESLLFRKLKRSPAFVDKFVNRFADLLNSTFKSEHTLSLLSQWEAKYLLEIEQHIERWKNPSSLQVRQAAFNEVSDYLSNRVEYQFGHISDNFSLLQRFNVTLDVDSLSNGFIQVNSLMVNEELDGVSLAVFPWTGKYFRNVPIVLKAIPRLGFKFKHWLKNGSVSSTSDSITVSLSSHESYKAIFDENILSENPFPLANELNNCGYNFNIWSENESEGSFPDNMAFVFMDEADPSLESEIEGNTDGDYDISSRTRINGLESDGVSFINTGNEDGNPGYPGTKLGGAILAINTLEHDSVFVSFKAATLDANSREYHLRLQYRVGDILPFQDLLDNNNTVVEYQRNSVENELKSFSRIALPPNALDKPYVQLFWRYYYTGVKNSSSGSRDEIRLDDVEIITKKSTIQAVTVSDVFEDFGLIESSHSIQNESEVYFKAGKSVLLKPGFKVNSENVFLAEIEDCEE